MTKIKELFLCLLPAAPVAAWFYYNKTGVALNAENILIYIIVAPTTEEIIFRAYIQKALIKQGYQYLSVLIASVLFALAHIVISLKITSLMVFFPSLIISFYYMRHKDVRFCIALHAVYNIAVFNYFSLFNSF